MERVSRNRDSPHGVTIIFSDTTVVAAAQGDSKVGKKGEMLGDGEVVPCIRPRVPTQVVFLATVGEWYVLLFGRILDVVVVVDTDSCRDTHCEAVVEPIACPQGRGKIVTVLLEVVVVVTFSLEACVDAEGELGGSTHRDTQEQEEKCLFHNVLFFVVDILFYLFAVVLVAKSFSDWTPLYIISCKNAKKVTRKNEFFLR